MSKLLINESPLQVLPSLAVKVGLNEAIFVQQLHWLSQTKEAYTQDGRTWVRRTVTEWREQFPWWSERTIKRIIAALVNAGLVVTAEHNESSWDHTQSYAIEYAWLDTDGTIDSDKMAQSDSDKMSPSSISNKNSKKKEEKSNVATQRTTASPSSPPWKEIKKGWEKWKEEKEPGAILNHAEVTAACKALANKGWTLDQVVQCANILADDPFFGKDSVNLWTVAKQIGAKVRRSTTPSPAAAVQDAFVLDFDAIFGDNRHVNTH